MSLRRVVAMLDASRALRNGKYVSFMRPLTPRPAPDIGVRISDIARQTQLRVATSGLPLVLTVPPLADGGRSRNCRPGRDFDISERSGRSSSSSLGVRRGDAPPRRGEMRGDLRGECARGEENRGDSDCVPRGECVSGDGDASRGTSKPAVSSARGLPEDPMDANLAFFDRPAADFGLGSALYYERVTLGAYTLEDVLGDVGLA